MKKILLSFFALICATNLFAAERISIKDFLEKKDAETIYEICGTITQIKNTTYGNFYVNDGTAEIYVYGLGQDEVGTLTQYLLTTLGIQEGDEIVVQGAYGEYNGTPEIINALYISHVSNGAAVNIENTPETAYTPTEAIAIIAEGKGLSQKVYVKGEVLPEGLNVDTSYGNATYNISDGTNSLLIYRGYYFDGNKFTSEDQLQDGDEVIVYGQLVDYNGTYEMTLGSQIYSKNGKTSEDVAPYTLEGEGTKEKPYTVADAKNLFNDANNTPTEAVWVKGIILGNVNTSTGATVVPGETTEAVATNLSVGDATGSNLAVQLPAGDVRAALNLLDNPGNLGKEVAVFGLIQKYCGVAGVKSVTDFVLDGVDGIKNINDNDNADANLYNTAGQRVSENFKGIVVKNGRKFIVK